jgi:diaminohydroxyphosphoribosylaminopyrimidine deaminase/5-amino-6-(5-phosphoribosylamino)uracil reductase
MTSDEQFMQQALDLAARAEGRTRPNPPVGALVVRAGEVIGEGFHPAAGEPHAEIFALRQAGPDAAGATLYVTLEPCSHRGRTGPCADAVIAAGISRVVVATGDPNPLVSGRGLERLRGAGIQVQTGILEPAARRLIAPFAKHVTSGLPFVILKAGMTLDGQTATATGESQWITNSASRFRVHQLRDRVDAILVGVGTVVADNPLLTTRLPEGGRNPLRVVVDSSLRIPDEAAVLATGPGLDTLIVTTDRADAAKRNRLEQRGVQILQVQKVPAGIDLKQMLFHLGRRGIQSLLLEGGASLNHALLHQGLVDRLMLFVAPRLFGGEGRGIFAGPGVSRLAEAFCLRDMRTSWIEGDLLVEGELTCLPA